MKKIDLSVIILNYNTKDLLKDCLRSIRNSQLAISNYEVMVVDNVSTDGSVEMVKKEFPWVKLIVSKKNLGFAGGNNLGVCQAKGRYILFLNPDTIVMPNTFREMIKFMDSHPNVGAATCKIELPTGKLDEACHRGFPTPWSAFCHFSGLEKLFPKSKIFAGYILGWKPLGKIHEIDSGTGAFLLVRRKVGEALGWWDEDYFWYGEDLDFCYRIKKAGWKIYYVPKVKIIHYKGVSSGIRKESQQIAKVKKETKIRTIKASTQAMRIFYKKHYFNKYPRFLTWLVLRGIDVLEKIRLKKLSI
ncbi:MAG: glycosyltransferase family 2 protein [Microgenomates group bacterium]